MASLIRRPTSRFWTAAFRDASGRQHHRSTGETDRKRAQALADKYEFAAKAKGNPQRARKVLSEFLRDHYTGESPFIVTRDFITQWLAARKAEISPGTFVIYENAVRKFLTLLGPSVDAPIENVTKAQMFAFRDALAAAHSPATVNMTLAIIRRVFRSARIDGYTLSDPAESVNAIKKAAAFERRPFTIDELRRVLEVANDEWRSLIRFGLYTGQRLGDLASLSWSQIDLERNEITLTAQKTGKHLLIPMAAPLREHILSLPAPDDPRAPVHPNAAVRSTRRTQLSYQFSDILFAAGLREHDGHQVGSGLGKGGKRARHELSFHSLRHTAVSLLKDAGVPDAVVMALVGHDSVAMSARYTHVGKEALARAAETLPEI